MINIMQKNYLFNFALKYILKKKCAIPFLNFWIRTPLLNSPIDLQRQFTIVLN